MCQPGPYGRATKTGCIILLFIIIIYYVTVLFFVARTHADDRFKTAAIMLLLYYYFALSSARIRPPAAEGTVRLLGASVLVNVPRAPTLCMRSWPVENEFDTRFVIQKFSILKVGDATAVSVLRISENRGPSVVYERPQGYYVCTQDFR